MKRIWMWIAIGVAVLLVAGAVVLLTSRTAREALEIAGEGGEIVLREPMNPVRGTTRVLLFALDGVGDDLLREMVASGRMPQLAALLGQSQGEDLYAHAYAVPGALSVLPSTTFAAWTSIFTGEPPARSGVPGNEWYAREELEYYAPGPNSVEGTEHTIRAFTDGFLGHAVRVPTLYERAGRLRSHVSLMLIHRGADLVVVPSLGDVAAAFGATAAGIVGDEPTDRGTYRALDEGSVDELLRAFERHGIPDLQTVYLPGIDLYTHVADPPIPELERYLEEVTDPIIGRILAAYRTGGVLEQTYVVIVSDHGHTPVIKDEHHALGTGEGGEPPDVLELAGFRMRPFELELDEDDEDYQATVAYQGAMAYVYLADRSTCVNPGERCSWMLPARFEEDVVPVLRAFDRANRFGEGVPQMRGTVDLILAREPRPTSEDALAFSVWDGDALVPMSEYLAANPRPEFPDFERRMEELGAGPYGHRAGDVLLLARAGKHLPIEERFYFSRVYSSWHGSPEWEDSRIPIVVARAGDSGGAIRARVQPVVGERPSQLDITPLILRLLEVEEDR
jgi:hypothetical protein